MTVVLYLILFGAVVLSIGYKGLKAYLFNRKPDYVIVHGKVVERPLLHIHRFLSITIMDRLTEQDILSARPDLTKNWT